MSDRIPGTFTYVPANSNDAEAGMLVYTPLRPRPPFLDIHHIPMGDPV